MNHHPFSWIFSSALFLISASVCMFLFCFLPWWSLPCTSGFCVDVCFCLDVFFVFQLSDFLIMWLSHLHFLSFSCFSVWSLLEVKAQRYWGAIKSSEKSNEWAPTEVLVKYLCTKYYPLSLTFSLAVFSLHKTIEATLMILSFPLYITWRSSAPRPWSDASHASVMLQQGP